MTTYTVDIGQAIAMLHVTAEQMPEVVKGVAREVANRVEREALVNVNNNIVMKRTGGLMQYLSQALKLRNENGNTLTIGLPHGEQGAIIAAKLEVGGPIRGKTGKLRIPLPPAMTAVGRDRMAGIRMRDMHPAFAPSGERFFRPHRKLADGGTPYNVLGISKGGKFEAWYALVDSVTLRAHPWFRTAIEKVTPLIPRIVKTVVKKMVEGKE